MPKTHGAATELASLLDGSTAGELIPELVRRGLQQLIELEATAVIGAERHERREERHGYRNGYRSRSLATQVGDIDLLIPKLRSGGFLPSILEPRRRVDQALYGVIMEAYIGGVSTRKVDALVAALGVQSGISKSQVSRICQDIDEQVQAFLNRPLQESGYAYVYLDATYLHGRLGKALQVCSRAVVVAMGVNADGRRELLGLKVGDSESEGIWSAFIASLKERGLTGVRLVVSDAHVGLTKAIRRQLQGCVWQRCRVHHHFAEGFAYGDYEQSTAKKRTKRERFLSEMEAVVPWKALIDLIESHYHKTSSKGGRPAYPLATMLRIHLMQQWYSLSNPGMEEALIEVPTMRRFAGIDLVSERIPDETTILAFRHLLEKHNLGEQIFQAVKAHLKDRGMAMKQGTIIDATLIAAPSSTKNKAGERDPEMHQTKKGNQWYYGMIVHISVFRAWASSIQWRSWQLTCVSSLQQLRCSMLRKT